MTISSMGVTIVYLSNDKKPERLIDTYRAKRKGDIPIEELLKSEIDNIAKKYDIEKQVIAIKFTG